ncbi:hypothetical protein CDAR_302391 [Caerostris darwini]|uniref:Uncharacterized protein n=1 Tax=Caerostris darwini TaxID=1538125 RepID=A0AAV4UEX5_9ARAC|nr:hypothetical protein CDAR_302391 [Caerostris darwini]
MTWTVGARNCAANVTACWPHGFQPFPLKRAIQKCKQIFFKTHHWGFRIRFWMQIHPEDGEWGFFHPNFGPCIKNCPREKNKQRALIVYKQTAARFTAVSFCETCRIQTSALSPAKIPAKLIFSRAACFAISAGQSHNALGGAPAYQARRNQQRIRRDSFYWIRSPTLFANRDPPIVKLFVWNVGT